MYQPLADSGFYQNAVAYSNLSVDNDTGEFGYPKMGEMQSGHDIHPTAVLSKPAVWYGDDEIRSREITTLRVGVSTLRANKTETSTPWEFRP